MAVNCIKCKVEIPEGRLKAIPGVQTCVECSTSRMKRAVTIVGGEREDTYNDLIIMEADEYDYIFGKEKNTGFVFPDDDQVDNVQD